MLLACGGRRPAHIGCSESYFVSEPVFWIPRNPSNVFGLRKDVHASVETCQFIFVRRQGKGASLFLEATNDLWAIMGEASSISLNTMHQKTSRSSPISPKLLETWKIKSLPAIPLNALSTSLLRKLWPLPVTSILKMDRNNRFLQICTTEQMKKSRREQDR